MAWCARVLTICILLNSLSHTANSGLIKPLEYKILSSDVASRDLNYAFDNDRNTQAVVHSDVNERIKVLIKLGQEYQIDSLEIISDLPEELKQSFKIGYGQYDQQIFSGSFYNCSVNRTSTLCIPACSTSIKSRSGVVGNTLLWSFERLTNKDWSRFYDIVIHGSLLEGKLKSDNKIADISLFKPYTDHEVSNEALESCNGNLWKLTDDSKLDSNSEPRSTTNRNVTIYFGKSYSISKIDLIVSDKTSMPTEFEFYFDGLELKTKLINIQTDCQIVDQEIGLYTCLTNDLELSAFDKVIINVKGLIKLHIYGIPFYYPQVSITSTNTFDPVSKKLMIELKCSAQSCRTDSEITSKFVMRATLTESCKQYGRMVNCESINLLRIPDKQKNGIFLMENGKMKQEIEKIMKNLKIIESNKNKLIVHIPRTHQYYGQYQCSCLADDNRKSDLRSPATKLKATDFSEDLIFDQSYKAVIGDLEIPVQHGFIELPEDPSQAYLKLEATGYSLDENIELNTTYLESGGLTQMSGNHAEAAIINAFPEAENAENLWPISAYQIQLQEAWPDATDDNLITVIWSSPNYPKQQVKDILRTLVITPSEGGSFRAWLWRRDAELLDIRVYHQFDKLKKETQPRTITLQHSGCSTGSEPKPVATVEVTNDECVTTDTDLIQCKSTSFGQIIQFQIENPPTTDEYALYINPKSGKDEIPGEMNELITSLPLGDMISEQLKSAKLHLTVESITVSEDKSTIVFNVIVHIDSQVIVDNSVCRPTFLHLMMINPEQPVQQFKVNEKLIPFNIHIPYEQEMISLKLRLLIGSADPTNAEGVALFPISFPNPKLFQPTLFVNEKLGEISWPDNLPINLQNLLIEYRTNVNGLIHACGINKSFDTPIERETIGNVSNYKINIGNIHELGTNTNDLLIDYEISVIPVFKSVGNEQVLGSEAHMKFTWGRLGHTIIKTPETARFEKVLIHVQPSQDIDCLNIENLHNEFNLRVIGEGTDYPNYLDILEFVPTSVPESQEIRGIWFNIKNLLPGRRYELQVATKYPTGAKDYLSEAHNFWIQDEVHVQTDKVFVSPGARMVINCTGAVGPKEYYQKRLEWKKSDGNRIPDGGRSVTTKEAESGPTWYAMESLILDPVEITHAGTYACFIRPSIAELMEKKFTPPTVVVAVSDIELDITSKEADKDESVQVVCQTEQPGELSWISPNGEKLQLLSESQSNEQNELHPYSVDLEKPDENQIAIKLVIPKFHLKLSGEYACTHSPSNNKRYFKLQGKESIVLKSASDSSTNAGQTLKLICEAQLSNMQQTVAWYKKTDKNSPWTKLEKQDKDSEEIKVEHMEPKGLGMWRLTANIRNTPKSPKQFMCVIEKPRITSGPVDVEFTSHQLPQDDLSQSTHVLFNINIDPTLRVTGPLTSETGEVSLLCEGYPAHETDRLQWIYHLPANATDSNQDEDLFIPIKQLTNTDHQTNENKNELIEQIQSAFRLGDDVPATWPGSTSTRIIAASALIRENENQLESITPEKLQLILTNSFLEGNNELVLKGSLICQYKQSESLIDVENNSVQLGETSKQSIVMKKLSAKDILETQKKGLQISAEEIGPMMSDSKENKAIQLTNLSAIYWIMNLFIIFTNIHLFN